MTDDEILAAMRQVAGRFAIRAEVIAPSARIEEDLRLTGDDALEFVAAIAEALQIDMSDFEPARYIGAEGFGLFSLRRQPRREPLPLSRLIDAARRGRWQA